MTGSACPLGTEWCRDHEVDGDSTHICQGPDAELRSGWTVDLSDFHEGAGPEITLNDPDCRLVVTNSGRLRLADACDLLAALAAAIRDASAPGALPQLSPVTASPKE